MGDFPEGYNKGEYSEPIVGTMKEGGQVFTYSIGRSFSFPYRYKDLLMITSGTRDTIFGFESNDTVPQIKYIIDAGKYINEKDEYGGEAIKLVHTFTRESNKHLFLTFNFTKYKSALNEGLLVRVLFNKETSQTKALLNKLVNDIDGGPSFWPLHISRDGKMVSIISAINFTDAAKKSSSQKMKQIAATLTEESNHVIIVVK